MTWDLEIFRQSPIPWQGTHEPLQPLADWGRELWFAVWLMATFGVLAGPQAIGWPED